MMIMDIKPFERVGALEFGSQRKETRKILGPNFHTFFKGPGSRNTTDAYDELDIHVYFNEQNEFEFIEIGPEYVTLTFEGIHLFQHSMTKLVQMLKEYDDSPEEDDTGFTFYKLGISLYSDIGEGDVQLISVFSRGYAAYLESIDLDALSEAIYGETTPFQQDVEDSELNEPENTDR